MSNRMKRWAAILLAMCLMTGGMWWFTPGKCAPEPKSVKQETETQRQAVILNALMASLNNPLLQTEAQSFSQLINANGLGGLVQDYLEMDFSIYLSETERTLRQAFETAMVDGNIGSGGPPYVSITNNEGQWTVVISNGPSGAANSAASPNSAPTSDPEQPGGAGNGSGNSDDRSQGGDVVVDGTGLTIGSIGVGGGTQLDESTARQLMGLSGGTVAIYDWDMGRPDHTPATVTFTPSGMTEGHTLYVMHYINGAWQAEGSGAGPTITVTFNDF